MARKKKPVDDTPICDPAYVRRIDPLWMPGPVRPRFWEDVTHRRDYLLWLVRRLRFRSMADIYRLKLSGDLRANHGSGLGDYWSGSALAAVQDCFPQYDWKPWLRAENRTPRIAGRFEPHKTAAIARLEIALAVDYNLDHGPQEETR
jgi:hypothetical protein